MQAMAGVTLFRDIAADVFDLNLAQLLPQRALPLSTVAPTDVATLFAHETAEVLKLMQPGTRRRTATVGHPRRQPARREVAADRS